MISLRFGKVILVVVGQKGKILGIGMLGRISCRCFGNDGGYQVQFSYGGSELIFIGFRGIKKEDIIVINLRD